jgi:hypothetical protein
MKLRIRAEETYAGSDYWGVKIAALIGKGRTTLIHFWCEFGISGATFRNKSAQWSEILPGRSAT